jgi:hypothetical protein
VTVGALRFLPAAAWMAVIFALSQRSSVPTLGVGREPVSIAGHFVFYGVLATLLWWGVPPRRFSGRARLAGTFAAAVLFGVSDEVHQSSCRAASPRPSTSPWTRRARRSPWGRSRGGHGGVVRPSSCGQGWMPLPLHRKAPTRRNWWGQHPGPAAMVVAANGPVGID